MVEQGTFEDLNAHDGYVRSLVIEEKEKKSPSYDEPETVRERPETRAKMLDLDLMRNDKARQTGDTAVYKYYYKSVGLKRMLPWITMGVIGVFCEKFPGMLPPCLVTSSRRLVDSFK